MRDKGLAKKVGGNIANFIDRRDNLDPACLATTTGMNLRLYDMHRPAKPGSDCGSFISRECRFSTRHGDPEAGQQRLGLMFMNIHLKSPTKRTSARNRTYSRESTTSLSASTAATELSNIAFSSSFNAISTTRSTPPAPSTTGTPT